MWLLLGPTDTTLALPLIGGEVSWQKSKYVFSKYNLLPRVLWYFTDKGKGGGNGSHGNAMHCFRSSPTCVETQIKQPSQNHGDHQ